MPKRMRRYNPDTGVSRGRMGRGVGSCDTYFNPGLFLHIRVVVLDLGSIDGDPLAGRSQILSAADSGSLPVVHLHERGWTRRGRGCRCHRHEKARQGGPAGRAEGEWGEQEEAKSTLRLMSSLDCARKRSCGRARRSARR